MEQLIYTVWNNLVERGVKDVETMEQIANEEGLIEHFKNQARNDYNVRMQTYEHAIAIINNLNKLTVQQSVIAGLTTNRTQTMKKALTRVIRDALKLEKGEIFVTLNGSISHRGGKKTNKNNRKKNKSMKKSKK